MSTTDSSECRVEVRGVSDRSSLTTGGRALGVRRDVLYCYGPLYSNNFSELLTRFVPRSVYVLEVLYSKGLKVKGLKSWRRGRGHWLTGGGSCLSSSVKIKKVEPPVFVIDTNCKSIANWVPFRTTCHHQTLVSEPPLLRRDLPFTDSNRL